jgi:hypothetical protein
VTRDAVPATTEIRSARVSWTGASLLRCLFHFFRWPRAHPPLEVGPVLLLETVDANPSRRRAYKHSAIERLAALVHPPNLRFVRSISVLIRVLENGAFKNSCSLYRQNEMQETLCYLFPIDCRLPRLNDAGSIPVSRSSSLDDRSISLFPVF